jgi:hypothetical protein
MRTTSVESAMIQGVSARLLFEKIKNTMHNAAAEN